MLGEGGLATDNKENKNYDSCIMSGSDLLNIALDRHSCIFETFKMLYWTQKSGAT